MKCQCRSRMKQLISCSSFKIKLTAIMFVWISCCYVKTPCNFCSCSCRFTASCASFCIVSNFSRVTDFMGIILGLQRTGIGVCSVKRSPCFGRTSLKTSLSLAILVLLSNTRQHWALGRVAADRPMFKEKNHFWHVIFWGQPTDLQ